MTGWTVRAPDGRPITDRAYPTAVHALDALAEWCGQFAGQGYYDGVDGRIPLDVLADRCQVLPPARGRKARR